MNDEVNALLQAYQGRVNQLTAQNIAFEAKILTLNKQLQSLQSPAEPPVVDGGEIDSKAESKE